MALIFDGLYNCHATRGDTHVIKLTPTLNGTPYTITAQDKITLTVRKTPKPILAEGEVDDGILIQIESVLDTITILPEDTAELDYGIYYYDIQFEFESGIVLTPVEWKKFTIGRESS